MPRPAMYSEEEIIDAATRLSGKSGPSEITISRISKALRMPTGSIYHRFPSRDTLLGEVWLRAAAGFQEEYFRRLAAPDALQAGLDAALYLPARVRKHADEARVLLLHRREDFRSPGWPRSMKQRADALRRQILHGLEDFTQRLFGRKDEQSVRRTSFAVLHAPFAAVRPHVQRGESPPADIDGLIRVTYQAVLEREIRTGTQ